MRFYQNALIALCTAATICSVSACKKENKADQNSTVAASEAITAKVPWDKTKPNAFLEYIPEDALAVFASTRNLDMQSDNFKNFKAIENAYSKTIPFLKDDAGNDADYGLDPDGHFDVAAYWTGKSLVVKQGYEDATKFRATLEEEASDLWSSLSESFLGKACIDAIGTPKFVEKTISEQKWQIYDLQPMLTNSDCIQITEKNMENIPKTVAVHYGAYDVTFALAADESALPALLEKPNKSFDTKKFGEVPADAFLVGYTDNVKIGQNILSYFNLFSGFEASEKNVCTSELIDILSNIAASRYVTRIAKDGTLSGSHVIVASDEINSVLRSLAAPHPDLATPKTLATIGLNLSVSNAIDALNKLITSIKSREFKCSIYANSAKMLDGAISFLSNPMFTNTANTLTSINLAIHDINMDAPEQSNFVLALSGGNMPVVFSKVKKLLAFEAPSIAMLNLDNGVVTPVDLKPLLGMRFTTNAILTNNDLVIATSENDVKAISELPKTTDGRIVSLIINGNIKKILDKAGTASFTMPPDSQFRISFGVTATGVELYSELKLVK